MINRETGGKNRDSTIQTPADHTTQLVHRVSRGKRGDQVSPSICVTPWGVLHASQQRTKEPN